MGGLVMSDFFMLAPCYKQIIEWMSYWEWKVRKIDRCIVMLLTRRPQMSFCYVKSKNSKATYMWCVESCA